MSSKTYKINLNDHEITFTTDQIVKLAANSVGYITEIGAGILVNRLAKQLMIGAGLPSRIAVAIATACIGSALGGVAHREFKRVFDIFADSMAQKK